MGASSKSLEKSKRCTRTIQMCPEPVPCVDARAREKNHVAPPALYRSFFSIDLVLFVYFDVDRVAARCRRLCCCSFALTLARWFAMLDHRHCRLQWAARSFSRAAAASRKRICQVRASLPLLLVERIERQQRRRQSDNAAAAEE